MKPRADACHAGAPEPGALRRADHAAKVDRRLARIEGQIRGVRRMVDEGRYCVDVLGQIEAIQQALRSTSALLLEAHLHHCVRDAFDSGTAQRREAVLKELSLLLAGK